MPDFQGAREHIELVARSGLDVFAHNVETVRPIPPLLHLPHTSTHTHTHTRSHFMHPPPSFPLLPLHTPLISSFPPFSSLPLHSPSRCHPLPCSSPPPHHDPPPPRLLPTPPLLSNCPALPFPPLNLPSPFPPSIPLLPALPSIFLFPPAIPPLPLRISGLPPPLSSCMGHTRPQPPR